MSRGSDIMPKARVRKSSVEVSESGELKFEEAEELDVGDAKEVIIYLPPSQDDFDSEVARSEMYRDYFPKRQRAFKWNCAGTRSTFKDLPREVPVNMKTNHESIKSH